MSNYKYSKFDYRLNQKMYMYADVSENRLVESYFFDRRLCLSKLSDNFPHQPDTPEVPGFEGEFNFSEKFDLTVTRDVREILVRGKVDRFDTDHHILRQMITSAVLDYDILEFLRCRFEISKILYKKYRYRKPVIESLEIDLEGYSLVQMCWLLFFEAESDYKFLSASLKLGDYLSHRIQTSNENLKPETFSLLSAFEYECKIMRRLFSSQTSKITI